jgi:hypothetical protein
VDGKPAPVLKADGAFLGVAVGPGQHTIELSYHRPPAAVVGRVISVATVLAIVLWLVDERWRTRVTASFARPGRVAERGSNGSPPRARGGFDGRGASSPAADTC